MSRADMVLTLWRVVEMHGGLAIVFQSSPLDDRP